MKVFNHDLVGCLSRIDRFREELVKSVSSSTSELNEFDRDRLGQYLAAFDAYLNWVVGQPQLDLPESHPQEYAVADAQPASACESEIVNDIVRIMDVTRVELIDSQSARKAAGLISFDEVRIRALLSKLNLFLTDYVDGYAPLDLPESSPQATMTSHGKKGS